MTVRLKLPLELRESDTWHCRLFSLPILLRKPSNDFHRPRYRCPLFSSLEWRTRSSLRHRVRRRPLGSPTPTAGRRLRATPCRATYRPFDGCLSDPQTDPAVRNRHQRCRSKSGWQTLYHVTGVRTGSAMTLTSAQCQTQHGTAETIGSICHVG